MVMMTMIMITVRRMTRTNLIIESHFHTTTIIGRSLRAAHHENVCAKAVLCYPYCDAYSSKYCHNDS